MRPRLCFGIRLSALSLAVVLSASFRPPGVQAAEIAGFGTVGFPTSCAAQVQQAFETAVARLHSFDGPTDAFVRIAQANPGCAIAWWGAAMSVRGNPLVGALDPAALKRGQTYMGRAKAAGPRTERERGFITALDTYYRPYPGGHAERTRAYEAAMERLSRENPDDPEVSAFYGLAVLEAVDLTDKTYARQLKAGAVLEPVWARYPGHPGAPHYLIHAYDYAPLAARGLPAAQRYAGIASGSVHAQHMPAHIFSMLGLWRESIAANHAAAALIEPHAAHAGPNGDAVEPHGMDFIAYARLQLAQDHEVAAALERAPASSERTIVQARFILERAAWSDAAALAPRRLAPLDKVTVRFVRALGAARSGQPAAARQEVNALRALREPVLRSEGEYWAGLVDVYAGAADAWRTWSEGRSDEARVAMEAAAALDDRREKHILLENRLVPMRELLGDLLLESGRPLEALAAYEASLTAAPNRFRSYLGAARAAHVLGRREEARRWAGKLLDLIDPAQSGRPRPEIAEALTLLAE